MLARETLVSLPLLAIGAATFGYYVVVARWGQAAVVLGGIVLVAAGYLLQLAESLRLIPDRLTERVDDEAAAATIAGVLATVAGSVVVLLPALRAVDLQMAWSLALFAALIAVLVALQTLNSLVD